VTWSDGLYVDYTYDNAQELTKIQENGATSGVGVLATYAYDNLGDRTSVTRGNGASTAYGYDSLPRLTSVGHTISGTGNNETITLGYNAANQIKSRVSSNSVYNWAGGYLVSRLYTIDGQNKTTTSGSLNLSYDARGNLTNDGVSPYTYDIANRLLTQSTTATLAYDAFGRLVKTSGSAVTQFAYDGDQIIAEYDASNTLLRRYVDGAGTDEPVVWYEGASTASRRWLLDDERGSIITVTDVTGAPLAVNTYDDYGIPGTSNLGRFQYTGQAYIPEVGLYHYKARAYSPTLGRFMQPDPSGYASGMNMYAYAGQDPVNMTDPSGYYEASSTSNGAGVDPMQQMINDFNPSYSAGSPTFQAGGYGTPASPWTASEITVSPGGGCSGCTIVYGAIYGGVGEIGGLAGITGLGSGNLNLIGSSSLNSAAKPQSGHSYQTPNNQVCGRAMAQSEMADLMSRFAVPGIAGVPLSNGLHFASADGLPGGFVISQFSNGGTQVVNTTTIAHFFVGSITTNIFASGGGIFMHTYGTGNAGAGLIGSMRDELNQATGRAIFNSVAAQAAAYAKNHYAGY
jgi:RHS repeat-associated protein